MRISNLSASPVSSFFLPPPPAEGESSGTRCLAWLASAFQRDTPAHWLEAAREEEDDPAALTRRLRALDLEARQVGLTTEAALHAVHSGQVVLLRWQLPGDAPHWVILWNQLGGFYQIADPVLGIRWVTRADILTHLYRPSRPLDSLGGAPFQQDPLFEATLSASLNELGISAATQETLLLQAQDAQYAAVLDAALRLVRQLQATGALQRGSEADHLLRHLFERGRHDLAYARANIPAQHWQIVPPDAAQEGAFSACEAVVIVPSGAPAAAEQAAKTPQPWAALWRGLAPILRRSLRMEEPALLVLVALTSVLAAAAVFFQAILLRALLDLGGVLVTTGARVQVMALLLVFGVTLLALKGFLYEVTRRIGLRLEGLLRLDLLARLPRLGPGFLRRLAPGELFERLNSLQSARQMPTYTVEFWQLLWQLLFTVVGLLWIHPVLGLLGLLRLTLLPVTWFIGQVSVTARTEARHHLGTLSRFYLDVIRGLLPVRAHAAEAAIQAEYRQHLLRWGHASWRRLKLEIWTISALSVVSHVLIALMVIAFAAGYGNPANALLLVFWAFNVDSLGQRLLEAVFYFQRDHLKLTRYADILRAPLSEGDAPAMPDAKAPEGGAHLHLKGVGLRKGQRWLLREVDLEVAAGEHIAVLGASGAGKTTLMALLLGLERPTAGAIQVDGVPLERDALAALRRQCAWVAPDVRLWNQSFLRNLQYADDQMPVREVVQRANLDQLLENAPEGLQTSLGEDGRRVSGGEGQRVRFGRALQRPAARLVLLDEPFRALDPDKREALLHEARQVWREATLLYVTHDPRQALAFDRVVILDAGRIVEVGAPSALSAQAGSQLQRRLEQDRAVREHIWQGPEWQRWRLVAGALQGPET